MDTAQVTEDTGGHQSPPPWRDAAWRREVTRWIADRLARRRVRAAGAVHARLRPWSVVLRVAVAGGPPVWFKANPPGSAFEPALARALHARAPGAVLEPIAVDPARGWSLMPDGGPLFGRPADGRPRGAADWAEMMRAYAAVQRAVAPHAGELTALSLPDLRPRLVPARFAGLLAGTTALGDDERAALARRLPRLADWCRELAESPVPPSVDHSDLHGGSVLTGGGRFTFFDWGDAALAHPFGSLLVAARVLREEAGPDAATALPRMRDAYLEAWTGTGASAAELRRLASLACRVAAVIRADSWRRVFPGGRPAGAGHDADVARWLRETFRDPPL
jgi:hypothetical protein